jgi:glyoxylase-like metal-dependent hydrolase (beta-lactamase superfamily II)/ferredoxin
MADPKKRLDGNVDGLFFVDSTCIDCDTCRQLAPLSFTDQGDYSVVFHQPESKADLREATRALLACPTGSIGTIEKIDTKNVVSDFPLLVDGDIHYNGFCSPDSFGGSSYVLKHPEGNWMIDSPKWMPHLAKRFEEMGGLRYIFLTHQDDVADAERYAERFKAERIIHRAELRAQPDAEIVIDGEEPLRFKDDLFIIPTPGHTRGHCVLLFQNKYLFTGDHLWWSRNRKALSAGRSVAWYSWTEQARSMKKLLDYDFEWVLPGHGERIHLSSEQVKADLHALIERMVGR